MPTKGKEFRKSDSLLLDLHTCPKTRIPRSVFYSRCLSRRVVYIHKPVLHGGSMATVTRPDTKARTFGENLESDLAAKFLRVVENAAIASARTMGQGDRPLSDKVATESMRQSMDSLPMRGVIVIGEGERDKAPMLYIGEKVG